MLCTLVQSFKSDVLFTYLNPLIWIGIHLTGHGEKSSEKKWFTKHCCSDMYSEVHEGHVSWQTKGFFKVNTWKTRLRYNKGVPNGGFLNTLGYLGVP